MVLFLHYEEPIDCNRPQFQLPSCNEHHKHLSAAYRKSDRYQFRTILCSCSSDPQGKHSLQEAPARRVMYWWLPRGHCLLCSAPWQPRAPRPPSLCFCPERAAKARGGVEQERRRTPRAVITGCDRRVSMAGREWPRLGELGIARSDAISHRNWPMPDVILGTRCKILLGIKQFSSENCLWQGLQS